MDQTWRPGLKTRCRQSCTPSRKRGTYHSNDRRYPHPQGSSHTLMTMQDNCTLRPVIITRGKLPWCLQKEEQDIWEDSQQIMPGLPSDCETWHYESGKDEGRGEICVMCVYMCWKQRQIGRLWLTIFQGANLDGGRAGPLAPHRLGGHTDVVDGVRREVLQEVGDTRRRDGDTHVLPEVRVVVVELVGLDRLARVFGRVPGELDGVGRHGLPLQVGRLFRHCKPTEDRGQPQRAW